MKLAKLGYGIGLLSSLFLLFGTCENPVLGPQGNQGLPGDPGSKGPQGDQGPQGPIAINGNRLKNMFMVSEDGAKVQIGFWDTLRNESCSFQSIGDGNVQVLRCMPKLNPGKLVYRDPTCMQPAILFEGQLSQTCASDNAKTYFIVEKPAQNACGAVNDQIYQVEKVNKITPNPGALFQIVEVPPMGTSCVGISPLPATFELYDAAGKLPDTMEDKLVTSDLFVHGSITW